LCHVMFPLIVRMWRLNYEVPRSIDFMTKSAEALDNEYEKCALLQSEIAAASGKVTATIHA
jgi:hypothetical protein